MSDKPDGVVWDLTSFFPTFNGPEMKAFKKTLAEDIDAMKQRQLDFIAGRKNVHHYELNITTPSGKDHILEVHGNLIKQNNKTQNLKNEKGVPSWLLYN